MSLLFRTYFIFAACDWTLQASGEASGDDGLGSQSYVPFSLPKDPDTAEDATKYVHTVLPRNLTNRRRRRFKQRQWSPFRGSSFPFTVL